MFALALPLLLGVTGLAIDVGMWYQNQVALQSAADNAALTSAMNDARLGATTASDKAIAAAQIAANAADSATNSQFNFSVNNTGSNTNPKVTVSCCTSGAPSAVGAYNSTIAYTATVNAPRSGILSHVVGMGLSGLSNGTQYAAATAVISSSTLVTGNSCLAVNPQDRTETGITFINDNGGGSSGGIYAKNCSIVVNCGSGNTAFNPPNSNNSVIEAQSIVVAAANGCTVGYASNLQTTSDNGSTTIACTNATSGCNLTTSSIVAPNLLSQIGDALGDQASGTSAWQAACSAAGFNNSGSINLYTAFPTHQYVASSSLTIVDNYGSSIDLQINRTYNINLNTYCEPNSPNANDLMALNTGGTFFFPNGLTLTGTNTFGPGIYYFGGNLSGSGGNALTSTSATLVFVGSATITMTGNGKGNNSDKIALAAPDSSLGNKCLTYSQYNNSNTPLADAQTLDGTNGGGICGIAIYQGLNDGSMMTLKGDTGSTITGIIYAPKANLTLSGNGGFAAGAYAAGSLNGQLGTLSVMVNSVTLNGNGRLDLNINQNDNAGTTVSQLKSSTTSSPPVLIN